MDKFMKDLNNELERNINKYFLSKESIIVHNNPIYIDTNHNKKPIIGIEPFEISLDDIQGKASFLKEVKGQIEFMEKIDFEGKSSQASLYFKFAKTSILYVQLNKQFEIELGTGSISSFCNRALTCKL
jgi:hypothetical protein